MSVRNIVLKIGANQSAFLFILFACLLFFLQYPLNHSFTGDRDTFYNLAAFHQIRQYLEALVSGRPDGMIYYPETMSFFKQFWLELGANFGIGIIHVLISYAGLPDLWTHWLFMSILFALNGYCLFLLATALYTSRLSALLVSMFYIFSHFMLANLENINTLVFFASFLSLYWYKLYTASMDSDKPAVKMLYGSVAIGTLQIYLSPYNFVIHCLIWVAFIAVYELKKIRLDFWKHYAFGMLIIILLIMPYVWVFFISGMATREMAYYEVRNYIHIQSLNLDDFLRVLPNQLYLKSSIFYDNPFLSKIRAAFPGITMVVLALAGLGVKKLRTLGLGIFLVGLVFAVGPFITVGQLRRMPNIIFPLYEFLDLYDKISVPVRLYFVALLGLVILAVNGFVRIRNLCRLPYVPALLVLLALAENIPVPMETYDHTFIARGDSVANQLIGNPPEGKLYAVLNLPSSSAETHLNYRREHIYMYWQSMHGQNILNGSSSFIPERRRKIDEWLSAFDEDNLRKVIEFGHVDWVLFNISLVQNEIEADMLDELRRMEYLQEVEDTGNTVVFKVSRNLANISRHASAIPSGIVKSTTLQGPMGSRR